ncbi:hypothetical protein ACU4GI_33345 [Cupriavidus basilensis]
MQANFTAELAQLLKFTGDTAMAIRMYSAYSGGSPAGYLGRAANPTQDSLDLMFLADALHHFSRLGDAVQGGSPHAVVDASNALLRAFSDYDTERPEYGRRQPKPTFDAWARLVCLADAKDAIAAIQKKAAAMVAS